MGRVMFYHLTRAPLEQTLPVLLQKSLEAGFQVDLRASDAGRLAWLDEKLWLEPEDGFLPHGLAGGPHDDMQPILLTTSPAARPGTACLMAIDGAAVAAEEATRLERVCILFDGNDGAAVATAREQWRAVTATEAVAEYWSQDSGRWERKMTTAQSG